MPLDRDRVGTSGAWERYLQADAASTEVVRRLNAAWRLPTDVRIGVYSNGREQGIRLTRPGSPDRDGLTIWLAEYRTSDNIVLYRHDDESDAPSFSDLEDAVAERIYADKLMLRYDEHERAAELIAEWFCARPLGEFAPPTPGAPRRRSLREALGRTRG